MISKKRAIIIEIEYVVLDAIKTVSNSTQRSKIDTHQFCLHKNLANYNSHDTTYYRLVGSSSIILLLYGICLGLSIAL